MKRFLLALFIFLPTLVFAQGSVVQAFLGGLSSLNYGALNGGLVYSYAAGTTTPKALYAERTLLTTLDNPLSLDIDGRAVVYGSGVYKFVVKTKQGVTVFTADNVEVTSLQALADNPIDPFGTDLQQTNMEITNLTVASASISNLEVTSLAVGSDAPGASSSAGLQGTITYDSNYLYICTDTDTWIRIASSTWSE